MILLKELLNDEIALFPGAFKPMHKGHFDLIMSIPANKVILFISPKERHGLTYKDSISIINLYKEVFPSFNKKIEISDYTLKYNSPVTAMYELLRSGKLAGKTLILTKSDKDIEDNRYNLYQKYAKEGKIKKVKLYNFKASTNENDIIGSTKIMQLLNNNNIKEALKYFPKKLIDIKGKELINILTKNKRLTEGGNVFDDVVPIKREYVEPTLKELSKELILIFPNFKAEFSKLGSTGKKDISGDIDLGLSTKLFFNDDGTPKLEEWGFDNKEYQLLFDKFTKRARTSKPEQIALRTMLTLFGKKINKNSNLIKVNDKSTSSGMLFFKFPQFDEKGNKLSTFIQIDIIVGDISWLEFTYYSDVYKGNIKGLHRTQLIVALFANKGYVFSHTAGVKNKETQKVEARTPDEALKLLNRIYKIKLNKEILSNYFTLIEYLKKNLKPDDYSNLLDTYFKILESTRADIPENLQKDWLERKDRLGLTGKFLPNNSKLKKFVSESGVVGGDRIPANILNKVVEDYYNKVLSGYDKYISHTITGSSKTKNNNKLDYGDIDLIVTVVGTDKKQAKKDFAEYVSSLPENIISKFRGKYEGRKYYISGELVTVAFNYNGAIYQIDNNISLNEKETKYKAFFLDMPAEKQGLISGLVKVATAEEDYETIFKRMGIKLPQLESKDERYEFTISGTKLSLRRVKLTPDFKEISRKEVWSSTDWNKLKILLNKYDLNSSFLELLDKASRLLSSRSKIRVRGLFNSLVSVKSGEVGTAKGEHKEKMISLLNKKLK